MLADMPAGHLSEWMAFTTHENEEMDKRKRQAADASKTEKQAKANARSR